MTDAKHGEQVLPEWPSEAKRSGRKGESRYAKYLDGRVWKLDPKAFGVANGAMLQQTLLSMARRVGRKIRTCRRDGMVMVQAFLTREEGEQRVLAAFEREHQTDKALRTKAPAVARIVETVNQQMSSPLERGRKQLVDIAESEAPMKELKVERDEDNF